MRDRRLIKNGSPCFIDYADKTVQSVSDAKKKGVAVCSNWRDCNRNKSTEIGCVPKIAQLLAGRIIESDLSLPEIIEGEKRFFLDSFPQNRFWARRNSKWFLIDGRENIINDIISFSFIVLDLNPDERQLLMKGKYETESGLPDLVLDAVLDRTEKYGEVK